MKLSSRIVLNVLFSTVVLTTFANKWEKFEGAKEWLVGHQRDLTIGSSSAAAGALLMYLATNKMVKEYASKTGTSVSNFTKAQYQAVANYLRSLSKSKKIAASAAAGVGAAAAYIYFDGPGAGYVKGKLKKAEPLKS